MFVSPCLGKFVLQTNANPQQEKSSLTFTEDGYVLLADHKVKLSKAEYTILRYLADRQNELITRGELVPLLWSSSSETSERKNGQLYSSALNSHIYRIRKKLNSLPDNPINLKTEYDRGYVLQISPYGAAVSTEFSSVVTKGQAATTLSPHLSTYREQEIKVLTQWMNIAANGNIVGLKGVGKSHFINFLCNSDQLNQHLTLSAEHQVLPLLINLADIPNGELSTLYRAILRVFYEDQNKFGWELQNIIKTLYQQYKHEQDDLATKNAVYDLFLAILEKKLRIILILDHFGSFLEKSTSIQLLSLYNLNTKFKGSVCYITVTDRNASYYDPTLLGEFRTLIDTYTLRLGPLNNSDARNMIISEIGTGSYSISETEISRFYELSGGFPTLLYAICHWWMVEGQTIPTSRWLESLLQKPNSQHRLHQLWESLTQEEQFTLAELAWGKGKRVYFPLKQKLDMTYITVLEDLAARGLCFKDGEDWFISGELLEEYIKQVAPRGLGRVWTDVQTGEIYQGRTLVTGLQPLQHALLIFFLMKPRQRHTHNDLIEAIWPDDMNKEGVSTDALYQVVRGIRKAIEADSSKPRYLINWRGSFEGGYQFFPEGRPE